MMLLLRQFFMPFSGWPWLSYLGFLLLPVLLLIGLVYPRVAFGVAVWDYVILLALPFTLAPKVLRALICNRRLVLVPGFARRAVLVALLFTLAHSIFINAFAAFYNIPGQHWRNAVQLFVVSSGYLVIMQYAVTTASAVFALSLFPVLCIASVLFITQGGGQRLLGDDHLAWLLLATALGWLLGWWRSGRNHQFRPEHASMENLKGNNWQRAPLAQWLAGGDALAAPDATLLLGYPANLLSRMRILLYMAFLGPAIGAFMFGLLDFGSNWPYRPNTLEMFMGASIFPATFAAFQNVEWVARLKLLWLRRRLHRHELWQLLERQQLINIGLMLAIACVLTLSSLLFSALSPALLWHYPLLVVVFNALYSYYIACARTSNWPQYGGLILSFAGSAMVFGGIAAAWHFDNTAVLYVIEGMALAAAVGFRTIARRKLLAIDWLMVKPALSLRQAGSHG